MPKEYTDNSKLLILYEMRSVVAGMGQKLREIERVSHEIGATACASLAGMAAGGDIQVLQNIISESINRLQKKLKEEVGSERQ